MIEEKKYVPSTDIAEENIFSKPKCHAILSFIAYFQQNKKNIQRAHLIRALVKNPGPSSNHKNFIEKDIIGLLQVLGDTTSKIMFNSIANLDKTMRYLRKLGLITNQYIRGYPRIILTDKGLTLFYKYIIKSMIDTLAHDDSQLMNISDHVLTSFIPKDKRKTKGFELSEFYNND